MVDMLNIESTVSTVIKTKLLKSLKDTFPDLNCTTSDKTPKSPKFPSVYVHLLPAMEAGRDLKGTAIKAGVFTFQIEVNDSESQNNVSVVMAEIVSIMKSLKFEMTFFPEFQNTDSTYRAVMRCKRMIGAGDIL